jgi:mono/diheme cytochrome c family protein
MNTFRPFISIVVVVMLSVVCAGCSGKQSESKPVAAGDSVRVSDSTIQTQSTTDSLQLTYEQRQGKHLYAKYCAVCHGDDGKGSGFNAYNLDPKPRDFTDAKYMDGLADERIFQTISGGGRSVNRSSSMPSWGGRMDKQEIKFVMAYVRTFTISH